jgi:hypothetical protein
MLTAELKHYARVRGWCHAKAVIRVTTAVQPRSPLATRLYPHVWWESSTPRTQEDAKEINHIGQAMVDAFNKTQI